MDTIVYDVEIAQEVQLTEGGWSNPFGMGLGSAVAYNMDKDKYYYFLRPDKRKNLVDLLNGNRVITFNGIKFDSKVILGNDRLIEKTETGPAIFVKKDNTGWKELDLILLIFSSIYKCSTFEAVNKKSPGNLKLDDICSQTLNISKAIHPALAPVLYKEGKFDELFEYNYYDVVMTTNLYKFILKYKYIIDGLGKRIQVNV